MRTILIFLIILLYSSGLFAQTNYYTENKVFDEVDYSYQCELDSSGIVYLFNKENKLTYEDMKFKNTGKIFIPEDENIKTCQVAKM